MKRRLQKNLVMLLGIIVAFGGVVGVNRYVKYIHEDGPAAVARLNRATAEFQRDKKGVQVIPWKAVAKTGGTSRSGLQFHRDLKARDGKMVFMIGYMVPVTEGEMLTEFLLLPLTLESYWRKQPPMRDVVFVALPPGKAVPRVEETILVDGILRLNTTTDGGFYYYIDNAAVGPAMPPEKTKEEDMQEPTQEPTQEPKAG